MALRASNILAGFAVAVLAAEGAFFAVRGDTGLLRPPGAQGEADFSSRCVKCGKCVQSCPYQVLHPAGIEAGALVGSPVVDARAQGVGGVAGEDHRVNGPELGADRAKARNLVGSGPFAVAPTGVDPVTFRFSVERSTN